MVRDHIEAFEIPQSVLTKHSNETNAVNQLFAGLEFLYEEMREAELTAVDRFLETAPTVVAPRTMPPTVHVCAFHWYATTSCNLIKMIAWLRSQHDPKAPTPDDYVEKVIPTVRVWRNKVSAHFAVHTPHSSDTPADKLASIIPPTCFVNGRFVAGAYSVYVKRGDVGSKSKLLPWSLTETHEQLRIRYGVKASKSNANDETSTGAPPSDSEANAASP